MTKIRAAEQRDAEDLLALTLSFATSFVVEPQEFYVALPELLSSPATFLAVAEENGIIMGYVLAFAHRTLYASGRVAWVEELVVQEQHRGKGIGGLLMRSAEEWAEGEGCRLIALATRRAAAFYEAVGYEESATYFRKLL